MIAAPKITTETSFVTMISPKMNVSSEYTQSNVDAAIFAQRLQMPNLKYPISNVKCCCSPGAKERYPASCCCALNSKKMTHHKYHKSLPSKTDARIAPPPSAPEEPLKK